MPQTLVSTYTFRASSGRSGVILVQVHPRLKRRLDAGGGLHALQVAALDVLLDVRPDFGQRGLFQDATARRVGLAANEFDNLRGIFRNSDTRQASSAGLSNLRRS